MIVKRETKVLQRRSRAERDHVHIITLPYDDVNVVPGALEASAA